eukprot:243640_1
MRKRVYLSHLCIQITCRRINRAHHCIQIIPRSNSNLVHANSNVNPSHALREHMFSVLLYVLVVVMHHSFGSHYNFYIQWLVSFLFQWLFYVLVCSCMIVSQSDLEMFGGVISVY